MKHRVVVRPKAEADLNEQARYIARDSLDAALRFWDAAESAFDRLLSFPEIGTSRRFQHPALSNIRSWPIPGFEKYVIFYRATSTGVDVLRIIHAARDLSGIFGPEGS
ncbi:MAG TPA: type II toxin-antitoxin system RelE/ParE family toxin [Thermoanaerobaculia bacterium]